MTYGGNLSPNAFPYFNIRLLNLSDLDKEGKTAVNAVVLYIAQAQHMVLPLEKNPHLCACY